MRFFSLIALVLVLTACSHEAENTGVENSSVITMSGTYAMSLRAPVKQQEIAPGSVSHYERKTIVAGGKDGEMTPCARNFDAVMDNLEGLMAEEIRKNNEIADEQARAY